MSAASIIISQAGVAGSAGLSRDDLVLGQPVTLRNSDNTGVRSWRWRLKDRPTDSTATLTSPTNSTTSFTPDVAGSYLVELVVDNGLTGQIDTRICAVRETINGEDVRWPAAGEEAEANWDGNTRGHLPDLELLIRAAASGGVTDHGTLTGLSDNDHPQYLLATQYSAGATRVLHRETAAQDITNTAAVTNVLAYTMPAGTVAAGQSLRVQVLGRYRNTDNGNIRGQNWGIRLAGSHVWEDGPHNQTGATAYVSRLVALEFEIFVQSLTSVFVTGTWELTGNANAANTGIGDIVSAAVLRSRIGADNAVTVADLSANALLIEVTFQHSIALNSLSLVRRGAHVELLP